MALGIYYYFYTQCFQIKMIIVGAASVALAECLHLFLDGDSEMWSSWALVIYVLSLTPFFPWSHGWELMGLLLFSGLG